MVKTVRIMLLFALAASLFSSAAPLRAVASGQNSYVWYEDGLGSGIYDYSWADRDLHDRSIAHAGDSSIRLSPSREGALYLYSNRYFLTHDYNTLEFWIHGGTSGGQQLNVLLQAGGKTVAKVDLAHYLPEGQLQAGVWQLVQINLLPLRMPSGLFDGILLQDKTQADQRDVYVDDIRLVQYDQPVPNTPPKPVEEHIDVYTDALGSAFQGFTHGAQAWDETATVLSGSYSVRLDPSEDGFLKIYKDRIVEASEYHQLVFWINGGAAGGQLVDLTLDAGGEPLATLSVNDYLPDRQLKANAWQEVKIRLDELELGDGVIDGFVFHGYDSSASQPPLYLDDIRILRKTYEQPKLAGIAFAGESLLMYAGNAEMPVLTAHFDNGYTETVTRSVYWASSAPDVIAVQDGTFTALKTGSATVMAEYENQIATLDVKAIEAIAEPVYADDLEELWDDWSWGIRDLNATGPVHGGTRAIRFEPRWWQGVYFNREDSYPVDDYYGFEFWIHGGGEGRQKIRFVVQDMNAIVGSVVLDEVLPEGVKAGEWQKVTVRLQDLGITEGYFNAIVFQAWDSQGQAPVYIDDVNVLRYKDRIENPKPPITQVSVAIDAAADRSPVSPDIYGVNYEEIEPDGVSRMDEYSVMRWGGNAATRYNWELNVQNHASDWFYMNLPKENAAGEKLPSGSRTDQLMDEWLAGGSKVLLQVPTIGWTPKDRSVSVGYSVKKYGPQQMTECSYGESWCNPDAGNGVRPDGSLITNNDPRDTSKKIGPDFVARWIEHIQQRYGDQVHDYALDNEPMLWPYTHRDVHPEMTTSTEIWEYTKSYGSAIKEADPKARIFGPVVWGWCAYLYSAADGCSPGADYKLQGNKPFLQWYLEQVRQYEQDSGVRLIDYLDIHYYPTEAGVAISSDESKATSARRLKSLKALYDPAFRDSSSWIWEPVNLIPRMKKMIADSAPGTKLAITEYNFGNGRGISSGLAQAEALAIFGREGVDLATRWGQPLAGTPLEDAFKLYLNYDGKGGKISGDSVRAASSNVDLVGSYAISGEDGKLYILLFNKDTAAKQIDLTIAGQAVSGADVYQFDADRRLGFVQSIALDGVSMLEVPARSATLVVAQP